MKLVIALCLVAAVAAAPPRVSYPNQSQYQPTITKYENDNVGLGNYRFSFEQSDGTRAEQSGQLKNAGREDESLVVIGSFSWVGPDGVTYIVRYTADENGYNPEIEQGPGGAVPAHVATLLG